MSIFGRSSQAVIVGSLLVLTSLGVAAREEPLQGFSIPDERPEVEPSVDFGPQSPPPAPFPISPVDQSVLRGARHGFVNATSGNLAFSVLDVRLPGRMPIDLRRVYDSGLAAMLPAPPNPPNEPRWSHDLGSNWALSCTGYLVATANGVTMVTGDGDVLDWTEGTGGVFSRVVDAPTKHMKLTRQSSTVIVEKQLDGTSWTYSWLVNASGSAYVLTEVADRSGNKLTLTYNQGYLSRIANSDGAYVDFFRPIFDISYPSVSFPRNRVVRMNDSTGRAVYFDYNSSGQLTTATDVRGKAWTYGYASGRLSAAVTPLGETFLNATYDGAGRIQLYEADHGPWECAYLSGNVTRVTDAFDHPWDYTHAASGITTTVAEPTLGHRVLTLDSANNPATYTGPMGELASWTYDSDHRPLIHKPAGTTSTITYAYDATEGWVDSITGLTTGTTTFLRDTSGRVTQETDAYNSKTTATYATNGDRLTLRRPKGNAVSPASGHEWSFTYDTYGSPATGTDPTGRVFELLYSNRGDFTQVKRPDHLDPVTSQVVKATWTTKRDASGRSTGTITPVGTESYNTYDDSGRLINVTGPGGSNLRFEYDARFRLVAIWNEAQNIPPPGINEPVLLAQFTYDAAGNLETRGTSVLSQTVYEWDASGRLTKITDPLNRSWIYERDLSGRVKKVTWPSGRSVSVLRDSAGRVIDRLFPGGRHEEFTYDASGQLLTASVDEGSDHAYLTWTRDLLERPLSLTTDVGWDTSGESRTLSYTYDPNGNRSTVLDSGTGETTTLDHDALDRLVGASKNQGPAWTVTYDPYSGHRKHVAVPAPGGAVTNSEDWAYDLAGRVLNHQWSRPGTSDAGNVTYSYGPENRVLTQSDSIGGASSSMSYRPDGLLIQRADSAAGVTTTNYFAYDGQGQLNSLGVVTGATPLVETLLQYDAAGRLRSTRRGLKTRIFTWDDAPSDQSSAFKVWRSPNEETERSLEIDYGYDGRLRRAVAHHIDQQEPETTAAYLWSALDANLSLGTSELQADGIFHSTLGIVDLGGLHTRVPTYGGGTFLDHPLRADDAAGANLGAVDLGIAPNGVAPFSIGWIGGADPFASPVGVDARETQLATSQGLIALTLQKESRPSVSLRWTGEELPATHVDFIDDWSGEPIARRGVSGLRARALPGLAQLAQDVAPGSSAANPFSAPCNHISCGARDELNVPVDVCWDDGPRTIEIWTGSGAPPAHQAPQNCLQVFNSWWRHGGQQSCDYKFQYSRSTGLPESYQSPDVTPTGVSLKNGDFIEEVTDLEVFDAAGSIPFTRTYRSGFSGSGPLGPKWRHNWEEALDFGRDQQFGDSSCGYFVRWIRSDGSAVDFFWRPFDSQGHGGWEIPADSGIKFRVVLAGSTVTGYEVRTNDGTIRTFDPQGNLTALQRRSVKYVLSRNATTGRLDSISTTYVSGNGTETTGGARLSFLYNTSGADAGKLKEVNSSFAATTHYVKFTYNPACGELETAKYPPIALGYARDGSALSGTKTPKITYSYANMDLACATGNGAGYHMLATIDHDQYNPFMSTPPTVRVLANLYGSSPLGAASMISNRVTTQCFGSAACDTASGTRRIDYDYSPDLIGLEPDEGWVGTPFDVVIHDRRNLGQDIQERHHYYENRLKWISEDFTGANRKTSFHYNADGLIDRLTMPDGSCEQRTYDAVGSYRLLGTRTLLSREACNSEPNAAPGQVTKLTHEWLTGQVLTETGREAFPSGVVPSDFSPTADAYKGFTRFFYYDVHQSSASYPTKVEAECLTWSIPCPEKKGNLNFDTSDDGYWSGALVLSRLWPKDASGNFVQALDTTQVVSVTGRPISRTGPDGVSEIYNYYTNSTGKDWLASDATVSTGAGPLATSTLRAYPGSGLADLTSRFSYDARRALKVTESPSCERRERTNNDAGMLLDEARTAPSGTFSACPTSGTRVTLNRTRITYDLMGRALRSGIVDDINASVATTWSTYDTLGRLKSVTVNPDATLKPGNPLASTPSADSPSHLLSRTCYDGMNRPKRTISPEGRVTCTNYDALGRPIQNITYAALAGTGSNSGGLRCGTETDENGDSLFDLESCPASTSNDVVTVMSFDALDRPFSAQDPEGHLSYRWYDQNGNLQFVSDGKPAGARDPIMLGLGPTIPTTFNWFTESSFDLAGRPTRSRSWGRNGRIGTAAASGWQQVAWSEFDNLGRPRKSSAALRATDFVTSAAANLAVAPSDGPNTRIATVETVYRTDGKADHRTDAGGRTITLDYDGFGRNYRARMPAVAGQQDQVERGFDTFGRPSSSTTTSYNSALATPFIEMSTIAYDVWGRVIRTTGDPGTAADSENFITTMSYDSLSRIRERVQRWQNSASYSGWDALDRVSRTNYDLAGRLSSTEQRSAAPSTFATTTYKYSRDGLMLSLQDAEGNLTSWDYTSTYPGLGRIQKMLYPMVGSVRQTIAIPSYDKNGNPLQIRHQASEDSNSAPAVVWTSHYDDRGRLDWRSAITEHTSSTDPTFFGTNYQQFEYDDLGRIVRATDKSPSTDFADTDIVVENYYDTGGRLLKEDQQLPLNGGLASHKVESTYLPDGFRSALKYPDSYASTGELLARYTLTLTPDTLGRLEKIDGPQDPLEPPPGTIRGTRELLRYAYLGGKTWSRTSGNGLEAQFYQSNGANNEALYDRLGRVRGVRYVDVANPSIVPGDFRYGYDRVGNRTFEQRRHEPLSSPANNYRTRTYASDLLGRLTAWREGGLPVDTLTSPAVPRNDADPTDNASNVSGGETWGTLDLVGNWSTHTIGISSPVTETFVPNDLNQYTQVTRSGGAAKPFAFDWLGQLRRDDSRADAQRYEWDLMGRLTHVFQVSGSTDTEVARYRYDAFDRRVEKRTPLLPDMTTRYLYDGWRAIEERVIVGSAEQVRARYGFGLSLDEVIWMDRASAGGSNPAIDKRYFLATDALGSVIAATDDRVGTTPPLTVSERYTYDAYGSRSFWASAWSAGAYTPRSVSLVGLPFGFAGQRFDSESGLYYSKNRMFDPSTGRFLRRDPLGYGAGPSLYQYAMSAPQHWTDPLGLDVWCGSDVPCGYGPPTGPKHGWDDDPTSGPPRGAVYDPKNPCMSAPYLCGDEPAGPIADELSKAMMGCLTSGGTDQEACNKAGDIAGEIPGAHTVATCGFACRMKGWFKDGSEEVDRQEYWTNMAWGELSAKVRGTDMTDEEKWVVGFNTRFMTETVLTFGVLAIAERGPAGSPSQQTATRQAQNAARVAEEITEGMTVWRVWGGRSNPEGHSWTFIAPTTLENYRDAAGLPIWNTGEFVSEGILVDTTRVTIKSADPFHGNKGGLPELLIPNPTTQVRLKSVTMVDTPF